ncbi:hypothetical protein BKA69DRAFT_211537 [Paraphysoderma sedebokerense]|nr:hypothetical protein BKA69DRAFT_211537 [Paraphysoderma sedebokerense]
MSAQHLAASLDSARLFEELEQMNRSLENMVQQRTAELEHKTVLLEQAKQEALQAASSKSIFLSNMSHEIRTPISQVVLASELMGETALSNEAQEYRQSDH